MKKNTAGRTREDGKRGAKESRLESERGGWPEARGRGNQCSGEAEMLDSLSGLETLMAKDEKDGSSCGGEGFRSCFLLLQPFLFIEQDFCYHIIFQ